MKLTEYLAKDIPFPAPSMRMNFALGCVDEFNARAGEPGRSTPLIQGGAMLHHMDRGVQMRITKQVSDDLQASDISDPKFESLKWPHDVLEMYFEDPDIPTFLAQLTTPRTLAEKTYGYVYPDPRMLDAIMPTDEGDDLKVCIVAAAPHATSTEFDGITVMAAPKNVDIMAARDMERAQQNVETMRSHRVDGEEGESIAELCLLLFKVLLFASSTGCAPVEMLEKPSKNQGGKPGFKNRPNTRRLAIKYLPEQLIERRKHAETVRKESGREFNGRNGHWREFKSDKFVNLRGTRKFIYPVPGPDGKLPVRKFVVRKPKGMEGAIQLDQAS